jgi:iron complex outermembrane receptor protein
VTFSPEASAFVGVGHVQRFPDYWELFSPDAGPAGAANAFEGVQPERTTQLDVGAHVRSGRLQAWASAYVGQIRDFILFTYTSGMMGSTSAVENVDARIAGGEAGLGFAVGRRWNGDLSLAYAWGENRSQGVPLPQIPPFEVRGTLQYDDQVAWSGGAIVRLAAEQNRVAVGQGNVVGQDFGPSDAFAVLSLNGARRLPYGMRLAAGVDNLLDATYSEHLNLAGDSAFGYPAEPVRVNEPGRTIWAKLDLRR